MARAFITGISDWRDALRAGLARLGRDAGAAAIAGLGLVLLAALATYSPADPSLNTAAAGGARNLLGAPGAVLADLVLQLFGWTAALLATALVATGALMVWRGPGGVPNGSRRAVAAAGVVLCAAAASAALPVPERWPLAAGLGGIIGDGLMWLVSAPFRAVDTPGAEIVMAVLLALIALWLATVALLVGWRDAAAAADTAGLWWATARVWIDDVRARFAGGSRGPQLAPAPWRKDALEADPLEDMAPPAPVKVAAARPKAAADIPIANGQGRKDSGRAAREAQRPLPLVADTGFRLPLLDFLAKPKARPQAMDEASLRQNARLLVSVLSDFGVKGEITQIRPGPVVTLYELEPAPGVKSARVIGLADDIARSMAAVACRVAVVPGKNAIGIELPNARRETVFLRDLLASSEYDSGKHDLPFALGATIGGEPHVADLARMPHLLIAGTTGSGKSVGVNAMILSLLYRLSPEQCRMVMIDPKMLELSVYEGIPHLLAPVVTDPKKAIAALKWTVREMEERYRRMSKLGVRNIAGFNERVKQAAANGEELKRTVQTGWDADTGKPIYETDVIDATPMPFIVVVIDEMADLMLVAGKEIEGAVQRLAQMARAAGIHLVTATQRPSVDVITGTIKANFPTRISYQVTSRIDSRTILGEQGAEQLLGQGDLLFMAGGGRIRRLHGPFVSDDEVLKVVEHLRAQGEPQYLHDITAVEDEDDGLADAGVGTGDALFDEAVEIVRRDRKASTSYLQRQLTIGYNRAANLMEKMERAGIVGPANHAGKREILLPD